MITTSCNEHFFFPECPLKDGVLCTVFDPERFFAPVINPNKK